MASEFERWTLPTKQLGVRVHVHDCIDSTNTLALSLGNDPSHHGLVILTRTQAAGRGQYGRTWVAPPGSSVLMSVLLFPPPELRRPAVLTAWAAVSVCDTVLHLANLDAIIKWPNDVLVRGKKICGILIEQRTTGHADFPLATVVGVGLNVTQSAEMFKQAGLPLAASLASLSGLSFAFEDVAQELIRRLDDHYHRLLGGDLHTLEENWKRRLDLLTKHVRVEGVTKNDHGRLLDATLDGIILDVDGDVLRLAPETIRHIHAEAED